MRDGLPHILLITMLFVVSMTGLGWLPIWFQDRKHKAVFWSMVAGLLFGVGMACRTGLLFLPSIMLGNGGLLVAHGVIWTAYRSLRKRPPMLASIILPVAVWEGLCLTPAFQADVNLRIFAFCILSTGLNLLAIREVWLLRRGSAVVRGWVLGVLGGETGIFLAWGAWMLTQPVTKGLTLAAIPGIVPVLFGATGFILLLGPAIVALDKELSDLRHLDDASSDFMTGVGNRRYFEEALARHFSRTAKEPYPLSLIMVDADYFKDYNDLYGHPAGDRCLQALADALKYCCRPNDVVGRYGGEEFAILLPGTDIEMSYAIARRMLFKVRQLRLEHKGSPRGIVTISIGVASVEPDGTMPPDMLVTMADRALYRAKRSGRDRICLAADDGPAPLLTTTAVQ